MSIPKRLGSGGKKSKKEKDGGREGQEGRRLKGGEGRERRKEGGREGIFRYIR